ncbi:MAG: putative Fe-S cluster assembly protein SufT [Deltaproteobacteria bacterium]|nr:putative Fe-S cluster assembly protein SufT [Deltaproteobacteria bacterium]
MKGDVPIKLSRDCDAVMIPSGDKLRLVAGSCVWITQSLGGSFTVMTDRGYMARIRGRDADALGIEERRAEKAGMAPAKGVPEEVEKLVWDQLKTCFDPEIPVNIVDLGLVYHCRVSPLAEGGNRVEVKFTLTAPGCGMGEILKVDIRDKILGVPAVKEVDVELVWDPPWDQSMISGAAKIELGMV